MTEEKQMHRFSDKDLIEQRNALSDWVRALTREGATPTLMIMALEMVKKEMDRRGLKDENESV